MENVMILFHSKQFSEGEHQIFRDIPITHTPSNPFGKAHAKYVWT